MFKYKYLDVIFCKTYLTISCFVKKCGKISTIKYNSTSLLMITTTPMPENTSDQKNRILIIDDDIELCEMLAEYLESEDFLVDKVHDGRAGIIQIHAKKYDAVVLDVMMPRMDGFSVLRELRPINTTPIIMLTAKGEDTDRIVGLEMGADDYLPKPCNPRELVARIKAVLRRTQLAPPIQDEMKTGELVIIPKARKAFHAGTELPLTSSEYNLLEVLARHVGQIVDKETLSEHALGKKLTAYDRSIDMHMSKLRQKLGDDNQQLIQTVRGMGYQLTSQ